MSDAYKLELFTPAKAESLTGVSTTLQRDWRRRGLLFINEGHARFDLFTLCRLWAMGLLADRGIGPSVTTDVAPLIGDAIAWNWLIEGDDLVAAVRSPAFRIPGMADPEPAIGRAARAIYAKHSTLGRAIPARFFVWWPNGDNKFCVDLNKEFSSVGRDAKLEGPVVVLDALALSMAPKLKALAPLVRFVRGDE